MSSTGHTCWKMGWILALTGCFSGGARSVRAANPVLLPDRAGDAVPRRTDPGANGPINPAAHRWPDILSTTFGAWQPTEPAADLYTGQWSEQGQFFRLDLALAGVMNPPGGLGCCGDPAFDPFRFGPNPVFGFIEIDVDANVDTGGEVDWPELRYTGVAARFGGLPREERFRGRIALGASAFDGDLCTPPLVERSGADFHIPLFSWEIDPASILRSDFSDWIFGPGETWILSGHLFQRSHAYRRFSSGCCRSGAPLGSYEPRVSLRFQHDLQADVTTISLVYPLTNEASAAQRGDAFVDWADPFFTNQNSVREALIELVVSTWLVSPADRAEPEYVLVAAWETTNPDTVLDPTRWTVTVVVGGSYTSLQPGHLVVWTDVSPDVLPGDVRGNGEVDCADRVAFRQWLKAYDGHPAVDDDGPNQRVRIANFGPDFSLFDIDYNGLVDASDCLLITLQSGCRPGDFDHDGDVDQSDFGLLQACFTDPGQPPPVPCEIADMNGDLQVDQNDLVPFHRCFSGAAVPSAPGCDEE